MTCIRITKEFTFDAAHALPAHKGACRNIHGHTYRLRVTLIGTPFNDPQLSSDGMVMDFGDLKSLVNEQIIKQIDHSLIVTQEQKDQWKNCGNATFYELPFTPSCENIIIHFAAIIRAGLPEGGPALHSLMLWETPTSYAEWYADDNIS